MVMVIRAAQESDAPLIAEFNIAMALETEGKALAPDIVRRGVEHGLRNHGLCEYFVAEIGGRVVGQLMVTFEWSDWRNAMFWWIQSVYVHPEFRRRGVFTRLLLHAQSLARGRDACGLRLYVERENENAQHVYRKLGLTETGYHVMGCDWSGGVESAASHRVSE